MLAVDDLQWVDAASAAALSFALRRLDDDRLGMLATVRTRNATHSGLAELEHAAHVDVAPLNSDALARLAADELGLELSPLRS